jgi:hypothetical protein
VSEVVDMNILSSCDVETVFLQNCDGVFSCQFQSKESVVDIETGNEMAWCEYYNLSCL